MPKKLLADKTRVAYVVLWGLIVSSGNALAIKELLDYLKKNDTDAYNTLYFVLPGLILNLPNMAYMLGSWLENEEKDIEWSFSTVLKFIGALLGPCALTAAGILEILETCLPDDKHLAKNTKLAIKLVAALGGLLITLPGEYHYFKEGLSEGTNGIQPYIDYLKDFYHDIKNGELESLIETFKRTFTGIYQAPITFIGDFLEGFFSAREVSAKIFPDNYLAQILPSLIVGLINSGLEFSSTMAGVFATENPNQNISISAKLFTAITAIYYGMLPVLTVSTISENTFDEFWKRLTCLLGTYVLSGSVISMSYYSMVIGRTDDLMKEIYSDVKELFYSYCCKGNEENIVGTEIQTAEDEDWLSESEAIAAPSCGDQSININAADVKSQSKENRSSWWRCCGRKSSDDELPEDIPLLNEKPKSRCTIM